MEVYPHNAKQVHLHQASYAYGLLDRFADDVEGKKASTTPAVHESFGNDTPPAKTEMSQKEAMYLKKTQRILGAVLWLVTRTRPDLAYAHSLAATYTLREPYLAYQKAVLILRYIAFPALGLVYQCSETDNPIVTVFWGLFIRTNGQGFT